MSEKKSWREMTKQEKWCADNPVDAAAEIRRWKTRAKQLEKQRTLLMKESGLVK